MIGYLKGKFVQKTPSSVLLEVAGVGYEVQISLNTYTTIQHLEGGLLYTHLLIREDAHLLYGFADGREKDIFLLLIGVSGIGAGTARLILSYMKPDELTNAIMLGNAAALEKIKGIGKKTAERAILELKDKLGRQGITVALPSGTEAPLKLDALQALTALGIQKNQAEQAIHKILADDGTISLEALIKRALKGV